MPDESKPFSETPSREIERKRFGAFRESGFGQLAEALWIMKQESPKSFWIFIFIAGWMFVNGINNITELVQLARQTGDLLKIFNPFAAGQ